MTARERNRQIHEASKNELRAALKRLLSAKPTNPDLQRDGFRISIVCVAKEAGLTPQAVHKNHKDIATDILRAAAGRKSTMPSQSRLRQEVLRNENNALRAKIAQLVSENATLLHRTHEAEEALGRLKRLRQDRPN